jgi:hypothetical protein
MKLGDSPTHSSHVSSATVSPSHSSLAWAAGFLEGEGCFRRSGGGKQGRTERVVCAQVNLEPLLKMQEMFGGSTCQYGPYAANKQPFWNWTITGSRARGVMMTMYPFLSEKKRSDIRSSLSHVAR